MNTITLSENSPGPEQQIKTRLVDRHLPSMFAARATGFVLDRWQTMALDFRGKRLIMNCSRQAGKSFVASALALHKATFTPKSLTLLISYTLTQAMELFRRVTELTHWINMPEPIELNKKSLELVNGSRIVSLSSTEGSVRGFTPDLIVVDEASRCEDVVYASLRPCLAVSHGDLILLSSPHGTKGFFWQECTDPSEEWVSVKVPASKCPRITKEFLTTELKTLGERMYSQEYECVFLEPEGALLSANLLIGLEDDGIKPFFEDDGGGNDDDGYLVDSKIKPFQF